MVAFSTISAVVIRRESAPNTGKAALHLRNLTRRCLLTLTLMAIIVGSTSASANPGENHEISVREGRGPILTIDIDGGITTTTSEFIEEALAQAKEQGAQALLIRLDTPGGLLDATRKIIRDFLGDSVPIIVWVGPAGARAGSAGVFITMASHVALMAPGTNIGAAHPVSIFGTDVEGAMATKIENDTAAWARTIAEVRGRNKDWAEKAVRESASITAQDAVHKKVVDFLVGSEVEILSLLDRHPIKVGNHKIILNTLHAQIVRYEMSPRQKLVQFLANPNLAYILILIGLFGLFLEFSSPGLIIPGLVGAICIGLVLGLQVMPINWLGMLLIVASAICLIADIYVTSFGVLATVGIGLLMIGSFMLFDVPESDFRVRAELVWGAGFGFTAIVLSIGSLLVKSMREPPSSGLSAMTGGFGEVYTPITPESEGQIFYRGSYWTAIAKESLNKGYRVRVIEILGTKVVVEAAPEQTEGES